MLAVLGEGPDATEPTTQISPARDSLDRKLQGSKISSEGGKTSEVETEITGSVSQRIRRHTRLSGDMALAWRPNRHRRCRRRHLRRASARRPQPSTEPRVVVQIVSARLARVLHARVSHAVQARLRRVLRGRRRAGRSQIVRSRALINFGRPCKAATGLLGVVLVARVSVCIRVSNAPGRSRGPHQHLQERRAAGARARKSAACRGREICCAFAEYVGNA